MDKSTKINFKTISENNEKSQCPVERYINVCIIIIIIIIEEA